MHSIPGTSNSSTKQFSPSFVNMEKTMLTFFLGLIIMVSVCSTCKTQQFPEENSLSTYIVHVKKPESMASLQSEELHRWYQSFLPDSTEETLDNQQRMVFSYRNVVAGFAAKLTAEEAKALQEKDEILSARPESIVSLHTTRTPTFLGLKHGKGLWEKSNLGKGIIIGIVDTGIYPYHPSFSDEGMDPPPTKWKGFCEFTGKRTCNNKLIGARNLVKTAGLEPPFEDPIFFHGTHTSAEAAGRIVRNASVLSEAMGTAVGMAPNAHIAMYKVCNSKVNCSESAILAAMDIAIEDGVDVLSLSLGSHSRPFYEDSVAVGAFAATQKGILVSCSAGNAGPNYTTLSNEAPWILTVGASTIDRNIRATAQLGNGAVYDGQSLFQPKDFSSSLAPFVYPGANGNESSVFCAPGSLDNIDVKGKVVLCELGNINITGAIREAEVKKNGGVAIILVNQQSAGFSTFSTPHLIPSVHLSYAAGLAIKDYINSTSNPTATILFKGTVIGDSLAPSIVHFSSRGPSEASPGILKPDITGPGVNILATWPISIDNKIPQFNIISGTSMSCPHLSGIAALLRNAHPDWSPAAIKSAIMTTAEVVNHGGQPILDEKLLPADIFATGAGHVNPEKANDPGLVFDIEPNDYIPYLCGLGYNDTQVSIVVQKTVRCSEVKSMIEAQLNYPSISVELGSTSKYYTRTVTNVGPANSTYVMKLDVPLATGMSVNPAQLTFTEVNQKATFSLEFIPQIKENRGNHTFAQGSLTWVSDKHTVRMPIAIIFK